MEHEYNYKVINRRVSHFKFIFIIIHLDLHICSVLSDTGLQVEDVYVCTQYRVKTVSNGHFTNVSINIWVQTFYVNIFFDI